MVALIPAQVVDRLDRSFRLLTGGNRVALPRQQTLQAALDWSYDLLVEGERCVFERLAVFVGDWTLEAAEAVCADGDIVGFSTICPHKGFPLNYSKSDHTLNCPGHYSRFDCDAGGQQIWGQATQNLPQYMLRIDANGDIYAEGLDELLYGRLSNVL